MDQYSRITDPLLLSAFQYETRTLYITVSDYVGEPVDLSTATLRFTINDVDGNVVLEVSSGNISVSGNDNEIAEVTLTTSSTAAGHRYQWRLWDDTLVLHRGPFHLYQASGVGGTIIMTPISTISSSNFTYVGGSNPHEVLESILLADVSTYGYASGEGASLRVGFRDLTTDELIKDWVITLEGMCYAVGDLASWWIWVYCEDVAMASVISPIDPPNFGFTVDQWDIHSVCTPAWCTVGWSDAQKNDIEVQWKASSGGLNSKLCALQLVLREYLG